MHNHPLCFLCNIHSWKMQKSLIQYCQQKQAGSSPKAKKTFQKFLEKGLTNKALYAIL